MRGLESLIPQKKPTQKKRDTNTPRTPEPVSSSSERAPRVGSRNQVLLASVHSIKPNPLQPRKSFDDSNMEALTESVRIYGVLQPLLVNRIEASSPADSSKYELIAGERRLRAAKKADLKEVPIIIREMPENTQKLEVALIENIQRDNLNPVEEGKAFKQLHDELGVSYENISKRVAKSQPYIVNTVRILKLPNRMQQAVILSEITAGHTRPLLSLEREPKKQQELFDTVLRKNMTVRETERMAQDMLRTDNDNAARIINPATMDADTVELLDAFKDVAGVTGVEARTRNGRARISISFRSKDDLHRWLKDIQSLHIDE